MLTDHLTTDSSRHTDRFSHSSPGGARVGGAIDPWHRLGESKMTVIPDSLSLARSDIQQNISISNNATR
jgi:hypothetical protein